MIGTCFSQELNLVKIINPHQPARQVRESEQTSQAFSVGWVEQGETQRQPFVAFGFASLNPTYPATRLLVKQRGLSFSFFLNVYIFWPKAQVALFP